MRGATRTLLLAVLIVACLFATGFRLVQGGDSTLESGEVYEGMMVFTGGNYVIEEGATVDGDVWMIGGNVELHGEITGDVHLYGGNLNVMPSGVVGGTLNDQRSESSGGDGFNVVDVGVMPCLLCCGLPLLILVLIVVLLVRRRGRRAEVAPRPS